MRDYYKQDIEDIDALISALRDLKKNLKRMDTLRFRECSTPKQIGKREADMNWLAMDSIKLKHAIHAHAVDLQVAEARSDYNDIELNPDGWHRYNFVLPKPRCFKQGE